MVRRNENIEITLGSSKNAVSRWYSDLKYTGLSQFRKSEKKNYLYPLSTQNNVALFSCFTRRFFFLYFCFSFFFFFSVTRFLYFCYVCHWIVRVQAKVCRRTALPQPTGCKPSCGMNWVSECGFLQPLTDKRRLRQQKSKFVKKDFCLLQQWRSFRIIFRNLSHRTNKQKQQ